MNSTELELVDIITKIEKQYAKQKCCGIYGLRCKTTNKWYIGQSVDICERFNDYKLLKSKKQAKIHHALLKYGYEDFDKVVIEECDEINWIMDYREIFWIKHLDSQNNGYNIRGGGQGGRHSNETKEKLRQINTGKKMSPETIAKMLLRPPHTIEARAKMSIAGRRPCSDATKAKMRLSAKRGPKSEEIKAKMREAQQKRLRKKDYP